MTIIRSGVKKAQSGAILAGSRGGQPGIRSIDLDYDVSSMDTTKPHSPRPSTRPLRSFLCLIAATGVPQPVPGCAVPPGSTVKLRAGNNTAAGNAAQIQFGLYRDAFASGHGSPMLNDDMVDCPVGNTAEIWIQGTAGDGLVVSIQPVGW